eukprot:CAMPEP_0203674584 /NCGR_PEP_ID=MMETSP0090-20130426/16769_1 /ASSEMBLY_ACC=CAM_ASM_001088 /TAXON_ID=426623 /ORGANISM="Chaetoceros affinis, Strain CCMP159" /LENGTH=945 /DNA_ID=CAMNT_0050540517 /DNA_START=30 /DNA_END=2867 /DNA_ORIENTATION=-
MASNEVDQLSNGDGSQDQHSHQHQQHENRSQDESQSRSQSQENINQLSQLFTKYEDFENDDGEVDLQGLPTSANGEDVDFPFLFWDYMDDGSGGGRGTPAGAAPQAVSVSNTTTTNEQNQQRLQSQSQGQPQQQQQQQMEQSSPLPAPNGTAAAPISALNASAQSFVNELATQIASSANAAAAFSVPSLNFGNFPFSFPNVNVNQHQHQQGFLGAPVPASTAAQMQTQAPTPSQPGGNCNFQQGPVAAGAPLINAQAQGTVWNSRNGQANSNGSMPQQQQQQQFANSVSILPKVGAAGTSEPSTAPNTSLNNNNLQQQQQQQQQMNHFLGALNQQIPLINPLGFSQLQNQQQQQQQDGQQQQQQQQQNPVQLMQQIQKQQQSMVYGQGNLMLPPQQQYTNQSLYQPQIISDPQGNSRQMLSQGIKHEPSQAQNQAQNQMSKTIMPRKRPNSSTNNQTPISTVATAASNKSNIVSSSDTDCEHITNPATKKIRTALQKGSRSSTAQSSSSSSAFMNTATSSKDSTEKNSSQSDQAQKSNVGKEKDSTNAKTAEKRIKPEDQMTEEERAQANRRRNREHARNTRARKKAYLESLKTTLDELCRERDTLVSERAGAASLLLEMQKTRTDVLLCFFALRSSFEKKRAIWSSILDESMMCVMPVTPYRSFPASEVQIAKCQRNVMGIDGMISDTASLHVLLNSLVDRSKYPNGVVQFRYTLVAEEAVVSGNQMMARWSMTTTNAVSLGAKRELGKTGMLCARFNSAHKIVALELMFDVMAFMLKLKQSSNSKAFTMVPNTVQTCIGPFENTPMVMTTAERPFTIRRVNAAWEEMTQWKSEEVVGKLSCKILQGERTEKIALESLMNNLRYQRPVLSAFTNYDRRGRMFRNFINIYPLSTDSKITHYLGLTVHYEYIQPSEPTSAPKGSQSKKEKVDNSSENNEKITTIKN